MDEPSPPGPSDTPDDDPATQTESGGWTRRRTLALAAGAATLTSGCTAFAPDRTSPVGPDDWAAPGSDPAGSLLATTLVGTAHAVGVGVVGRQSTEGLIDSGESVCLSDRVVSLPRSPGPSSTEWNTVDGLVRRRRAGTPSTH